MQLDGNIYCVDVVLDSFNIEYRDEDRIWDQNMKSKYFGIFIMKKISRNSAHNNKELIKFGLIATV